MIKAVIFDYGGVLADEGWAKGIRVIAVMNGYDPEEFFHHCVDVLFETGYVRGEVTEEQYWDTLRKTVQIPEDNESLRDEILKRFKLRDEVIGLVKKIKAAGYTLAILSDQVNWLDELNERDDFFKYFDEVYNSYHLGNTKKEESFFTETCERLNVRPYEAVFIDDNEGNVDRAENVGLHAIYYDYLENVEKELKLLIDY